MSTRLIERFAPVLCGPRAPAVRDPGLLTKHRMLRKYLLENFATEVDQLKDAVFVGLGPLVQKILDRLCQEGAINTDRVVGGMLHPSGNCTYRINYLIGDRGVPVQHATNPAPYDQGRRAFRGRFFLRKGSA